MSTERGAGAVEVTIDARGLRCPRPLLAVRQAIARLAAGQCLKVYADDPHAPYDLEVYCLRSGHRLRTQRAERGVFELVIEKTGSGTTT